MSVLMWKVNKSGNTIGQCDASCYGRRFPYKDCICEGKNHAVGMDIAKMNVRELFRSGTFPKGFRFAPFVQEEVLDFSPSTFQGTPDEKAGPWDKSV